MGTRNAFVGERGDGEDVGLGSRIHPAAQESCLQKRIMVQPQHHHHHHPKSDQLSSSSCCGSSGVGGGDGFDGGGDGGPLFCDASNQVVASCVGDIYDVVGAGAGAGAGAAASGAVGVPRPLHTYASTDPSFTFNCIGEMAAPMNVRSVPFTPAQWRELERQTTIYKYMSASVPVPPELLMPITRRPSNTSPASTNMVVSSSLELGISSNNSDPEPWRCRRTDGKKWRCSRDVAPEQKYCERHSHKSRPRSRKAVELPTQFTRNNANTKNNDHDTHSLHLASYTTKPYQNPLFISRSDAHFPVYPTLASATSSYDQPRCLEWFMKGETVSVASDSNQEWQQMVLPKVRFRRENPRCDDYPYEYEQHYGNQYFYLQTQGQSDECGPLMSPRLAFFEGGLHLNQAETQETRHFIDAWSKAEKDVSDIDGIGSKLSVSSKEELPLSSLTLSMYGGNETNEERKNGQVGTHVMIDTERESMGGSLRPLWMNPCSWMGSPPGGPLAEALCLGVASNATGAPNETPSRGCSISSTTTSSCSKSRP